MAGKENLVSLKDQTKEKQREIASMGGKASGVAKRRRKLIRETIGMVASLGAPAKAMKMLKASGVSEEEATYQAAIVFKMFNEALKGNVAAFNAIVNASGEVVNKHEVSGADGTALRVEKTLSLSEIRERLKQLDEM